MPNKCKFEFYLDDAGKPVIEAGNPECQLLAIEALQAGDVTVKVKPHGVRAEAEPPIGQNPPMSQQEPEPEPEPKPDTRLNPTES